MWGRFTLSANAQRLKDFFPMFEIPEARPRFNVAPTAPTSRFFLYAAMRSVYNASS
jgi:hypothetical protein